MSGHGQRAHGLTVVTARQTDKRLLAGRPMLRQ